MAIARIDEPRAVDLLTAALQDPEQSVRDQAAFQLGRLGGPEAEAALERYRKSR